MAEDRRLNLNRVPENATGLRLYKIVTDKEGREELRSNELVVFKSGRAGVQTVLNRASLSGRVEVDPEGELPDFYADVYEGPNGDDGWTVSVALDADSYRALKRKWMPTVYDSPPELTPA